MAKTDPAEATLEASTKDSKGQIDALLKSLGLTPKSTMAQFSEALSKSGGATPAQFGGGDQGWSGFFESEIAHPLESLLHTIDQGGAESQAKPKPKKEKPLPDPAKAAASVPESPYEQLAQALAGEYLAQVNQLMPLTSGSAIFGPQGQTNQVVNEAAGMIPGGGQWLQQQAAAEQKAAQPLQAAMSQVGEAQAQGAIPYAGAVANTGAANTQFLEAAPWQQILAELASETAYKAASTQGASAFGLTPQNTPAFLNQILSSHGLTGTAALGGLQPVTQAAQGGNKSSSSGLSTGTSQTG